jgi:phosphocarrier protein
MQRTPRAAPEAQSGKNGPDGSVRQDAENAESLNPFGQFSLESEPDCLTEAEIRNRLGLHGRAAARLVAAIEGFDCDVFVEKGPFRADAKSILDLLSLCCSKNTKIKIGAVGPDAKLAVEAARQVVEEGFGEEE